MCLADKCFTPFTPVRIRLTLRLYLKNNAQYHFVLALYAYFHPNWALHVEITNKNLYTLLIEVRLSTD